MRNILLLVLICISCSKANNSPAATNHAPLVSLSVAVISVDPFTYTFHATASDEDGDKLSYTWDFGDGTTKDGSPDEEHSFKNENKNYIIKVSVSDGKASPVTASTTINTTITTISIDASKKYQTMEGFGGFGAQDVYWSSGPFTSSSFVNNIINDLGLTILRDNIPTDFEDVNDDNDPYTTTLSNFHYNSLTNHFQYLKDMKAAGLQN